MKSASSRNSWKFNKRLWTDPGTPLGLLTYPSAGAFMWLPNCTRVHKGPGLHTWCQTLRSWAHLARGDAMRVSRHIWVFHILLNHLISHPSCFTARRHQHYCSTVQEKRKQGQRVLEDPLRAVGRPIFLSAITIVHFSFADTKYLPISSF